MYFMFVLENFRNPAAQNAQSPQIMNANRTVTKTNQTFIHQVQWHKHSIEADRLREREKEFFKTRANLNRSRTNPFPHSFVYSVVSVVVLCDIGSPSLCSEGRRFITHQWMLIVNKRLRNQHSIIVD